MACLGIVWDFLSDRGSVPLVDAVVLVIYLWIRKEVGLSTTWNRICFVLLLLCLLRQALFLLPDESPLHRL
jgi:hypothetical protein